MYVESCASKPLWFALIVDVVSVISSLYIFSFPPKFWYKYYISFNFLYCIFKLTCSSHISQPPPNYNRVSKILFRYSLFIIFLTLFVRMMQPTLPTDTAGQTGRQTFGVPMSWFYFWFCDLVLMKWYFIYLCLSKLSQFFVTFHCFSEILLNPKFASTNQFPFLMT